MNRIQSIIAAGFSVVALAAAAESAPLTLEKALQVAAQRPPEQVFSSSGGLPYRQMAKPTVTGLAASDMARIEIMARFFEVILTDMDAVALGERMTVAYGLWDRLRSRSSETTEALRAQLVYRELLSRRNATRMNQRLARSALAMAMGQAGNLPAELIEPEFSEKYSSTTSEILQVAPQSLENNTAASTRDHAYTAAALELDWLLRADMPRARARVDLADRLLDDAREQLAAGGPSDLGNAMASTVEAKRDERSVEFAIQLARERLAALTR